MFKNKFSRKVFTHAILFSFIFSLIGCYSVQAASLASTEQKYTLGELKTFSYDIEISGVVSDGIVSYARYGYVNASAPVYWFVCVANGQLSVYSVSESSSVSGFFGLAWSSKHMDDDFYDNYSMNGTSSFSAHGNVKLDSGESVTLYWSDVVNIAIPYNNVSGSYLGTFSSEFVNYSFNEKATLFYKAIQGESLDGFTPNTSSPGGDFDESTATYQRDIGVVRNWKYKRIIGEGIADVNGNGEERPDIRWKEYWDTESDTGFDLLQDNIYISFYYEMNANYWKSLVTTGTGTPYKGDLHFVKRVTGETFLEHRDSEIDLILADEIDELYALFRPFGTFKRKDRKALRIEIYDADSGTWTYGPYEWKNQSVDGSFDDDYITVTDPDGNVIEDSPENGRPNIGDSGVGNLDDDEALDNVDSSGIMGLPSDVDSVDEIGTWFIGSLQNLYSSVGQVPAFLSDMFSYLPAPIFVFIGLGIVVCILLRIFGR